MKRNLTTLVLVAVSLLASPNAIKAQAVADLQALHDDGGLPAPPTPGPDDLSQLTLPSAAGSPPGMNYYINDGNSPGQTFTTGTNANGYLLKSLAFYDSGDSGGLPAEGQAYHLNIFTLNGTSATLYTRYVSPATIMYDGYWYEWTNISVPLLPNTKYAYTVSYAPGDTGWWNAGNISGDPYPDGEVVGIPQDGGTVKLSNTTGYDASFSIGLVPASDVVVGALTASPGTAVVRGIAVTLSVPVVIGAGPFSYQWQTDGGSGVFTNIPGATDASLSVDTTGLTPGGYNYALTVSNGGSAASNSVMLSVYNQSTATLSDVGDSIIPGSYDISQLAGGGNGDGLNYYDDNGSSPGQTFTTGANSQGYYLNSVTIGTGNQSGGTSGHTSSLKPYTLQVYEVLQSGSALLIASYTNSSFSFTFGDWLAWTGFSPLLLKPNTTYAYSFRLWPTFEGGWAAMSIANNDPYASGQACLIPVTGGTIRYGNSGLSDAAFNIGLTPVGIEPTVPTASAITVTPSRMVPSGTVVTFNESAIGAGPLNYQWRTDGGSGGILTNIPSATETELDQDTSTWTPGVSHRFDVIVSNSYGSSTSAVASVSSFYPAATVALRDIGADLPTPSPVDIAQAAPTTGPNTPDGLNYYYNNDAPPGQTFTTGNNPGGYLMNSLAIDLAGDSALVSQSFALRIYTVSSGIATLYATYNSQSDFLIAVDTDTIRWSGLNLPLAANTTYAYTLFGQGFDNLANVSGNPYPGGEVCLIPPGGGAVSYGSSHGYDGVFVVGLTLPGYPTVSLPDFSPATTVYAGTPVSASATIGGSGPFTYQWQTDGGSGIFTDIPGATGSTLSIDTTPLAGTTARYKVIVGNGTGTTTGQAGTLTVLPAQLPVFASDITNSLYQPNNQVSTFVGGTVTLSATNIQGTSPISYQWQTDGGTFVFTNVLGATNSSLTLSHLEVSASGNYHLMATNSQGSAQTSDVTLTVRPQPANPFVANFQFHTFVNADVGNYSGPGAIGAGTFWNQVPGPTEFFLPGAWYISSSGYSDDGITDEGISWTLICDNSWGWTSSPTIPLLDSAANAYAPSTFLFNLPNGLYNLVLYSCNGTEAGSPNHQEGVTFTVNGVSKTILPTTDQEFVLNNNYVIFNNVVVTEAMLSGTWAATNHFGSLNGAQLEYLGAYQPLSIRNSGSQLRIEWTGGTLLQATDLTGPWTTNSAASPLLVTPSEARMFFKVQLP